MVRRYLLRNVSVCVVCVFVCELYTGADEIPLLLTMNVLLTLTDQRQCGQCADALFTQYG